jgi:hypothetical protein
MSIHLRVVRRTSALQETGTAEREVSGSVAARSGTSSFGTEEQSMAERHSERGVIFRAGGSNLYVLVGVFASFFLALGVIDGIRRDDWTSLAVVSGAIVFLFLLLSYLRLEIGVEGFRYRNLSTNRRLQFGDIERAYFATVYGVYAPQGVATFWVQPRQGKPMKINLMTFSVEAAAALFIALDRHGVPIEVPNTWAAQLLAKQIRDHQAKLQSRE